MSQSYATRRASRPRVILAEDDVDMAHVLRFLLERQGYDVLPVFDGRRAVDLIDDEPPVDLLMVDVMMPFVNGLQVVRRMRSTPGWEGVPALVVSGKSGEDDIVEAFEAGANDYVTKPFRPRELAARVRELIERHRAARVA